MKSTLVFLLLIILQANCALTGEDIKVEPIFIPNGICQKPKENDYVTLSYTWKLDDVNERLALQLHMGNSKYPGLEEIVKDMCKLQKNIVKIPAQHYLGKRAPKGKLVELELIVLQIGEGQSRREETFAEIDENQDQEITLEELMNNMHASEFEMIQRIVYENPENGTELAAAKMKELTKEVNDIFQKYDKDENGALTRKELIHLTRTEL